MLIMQEYIEIDQKTFFCDGQKDENEGHPKVYLNFGDEKEKICPYCGKIFVFIKRENINKYDDN